MDRPIYCGFCLKTNNNVKYMIVGLTTNICNECFDLCVEMISKKFNKTTASTDNLIFTENNLPAKNYPSGCDPTGKEKS